ncbi:hypothetical protein NMSP_1622 [Candidatus Nitrosomarinus catalina]|uniref:Uncharacterized protein n=1 Tax=Candidatus Nitrosomarinus catalinensis TaxID=1898749 RepID=A0A2Z2HMI8_9ARCH|nr:hypothetical protein NMSP_1622 [Candidatus Nitrosomarinus catalina]
MSCTHTFKNKENHMVCSKCGYIREFTKPSIKPKILVISLLISVMIVGGVFALSLFS